jgi:hypothetical protein
LQVDPIQNGAPTKSLGHIFELDNGWVH